MQNYDKGELAREILTGLALGTFIVALAVAPGLAEVVRYFKPRGAYDRHRVNQSLKRLQEKKLVRVYCKNGIDVVEITKAGRRRVLAYKIDEMRLRREARWHKKWYIVMFDIPEHRRQARRALSAKVKELGLYPLQKSVFVSPYPCKNEIDFIGEFFGVRTSLIYLTATEIENEDRIKKHFEL